MDHLNTCNVMFSERKYNYSTNVAATATAESCYAYFVGKFLNMGAYPNEDLQKCIAIEFTDNNLNTEK